jgi:hypothetical protein
VSEAGRSEPGTRTVDAAQIARMARPA